MTAFPTLQKATSSIGALMSRHVNQGVALTIILQFGGAIVAFAMYSLAARVLSPVDFGHLAMWLCVSQMGSVLALLGQEMFVLRSLNEYAVADRPDLSKGSLLFSIAIVAVIPLLLAICIGLTGVFRLGEDPHLMIAAGLFLIACSAITLSSHVARSTVGILLAEGMRDFFWRTLVVIVLVALIATRTIIKIDQFFMLSSAGIGLALMVQITAIALRLPRRIVHAKASWQFGRWLKVSSGFWASAILETVNQYFDVVIVYWFLDPASAGAYFVASRLANMFAVPSGALHNFATRRIPTLYFSGRINELNQMLKLMAEVQLLCVAAGGAILGFGAETILGVFGSDFVAQKWTLIILAAGTAFYAAGGPASSVLMIAGHEGRYPWIVAANIALRFLGFAIFIPLFGLQGAALAAATSLGIVTIVLNILCRRWLGLNPSVLILYHKPAMSLSPNAPPAS
jgi:O-antigen/teichoic acid export membrane protein